MHASSPNTAPASLLQRMEYLLCSKIYKIEIVCQIFQHASCRIGIESDGKGYPLSMLTKLSASA